MSVLEVTNLDVGFLHSPRFGFPYRKRILHHLSCFVREGEILGIIGESGSGKSTLARSIAGFVTPDRGTITLDGINIFPDTKNRKTIGSAIQMVFQAYSASLDPQLTIEQILLEGNHYGHRHTDRPSPIFTAKELCTLIGLPAEILSRYPFQLSGGQRQRVAFARAISVRPRLLILDEPTSALDVLTQARILRLIKKIQIQQSFGALFISHNISNSMFLCDRIAVLHQGTIVEVFDARNDGYTPSHPYTQKLLSS
jgi:ABC-type dipeptide/oligopeptide/nickel transport system ATPase subunit